MSQAEQTRVNILIGKLSMGNEVADLVRQGKIDGDIYSDGEIWADYESFQRWLDTKNIHA